MNTTNKFIVALSSALLAFFIVAFICFANYNSGEFIELLFLAQLIVFSIAACSVVIYSVMPLSRKMLNSPRGITKIVLLTESNTPTEEFLLINRTSALIGKNKTVYISFRGDAVSDEYAVVNRVGNYWYIERVSEARSVGLKRAGEQYVYKLKPGMCYKLELNDIMYIDDERLVVM